MFSSKIELAMKSYLTLGVLTGLYPAIFFISNNWYVIGGAQSIYVIMILTSVAFFVILSTHFVLSHLPLYHHGDNVEPRIKFALVPQEFVNAFLFLISIYILVGFLNFTIIELGKIYGLFKFRYLILFVATIIFFWSLIRAKVLKGKKLALVFILVGIIGNIYTLFQNVIFNAQNSEIILGSKIVNGIAVSLLLIAVGMGILLRMRVDKEKGEWLDLIKPLNVLLLILTLAAFGNLVFSTLNNYDKVAPIIKLEDEYTSKIYENVKFKVKPNIYLIVPDSYPSNIVLKRLFNFDNRLFSSKLNKFGFKIYDDYFSSYPYSLEGVHSLLSMRHNHFKQTISKDAVGLREEITGRGSSVINILKGNEYKSNYIHDTNYLLTKGCFVEKCTPGSLEHEKLMNTLQLFYYFDFLTKFSSSYDSDNEMIRRIDKTKPDSQKFIYKHYLGTHSALKSYEKEYTDSVPEFRKSFPTKIKKANKILLSEIGQISKKDPSAVIIIVADHGSWAGAERTVEGFTVDETLDKFNVFLAIKWGNGYRGQYDDELKSSANLFRYIFAFLSKDESILQTKVEDSSYLNYKGVVKKVVDNGKVLQNPENI